MAVMHAGVWELLRLGSCEVEYFCVLPDGDEVYPVLVVVGQAEHWRTSQTVNNNTATVA